MTNGQLLNSFHCVFLCLSVTAASSALSGICRCLFLPLLAAFSLTTLWRVRMRTVPLSGHETTDRARAHKHHGMNKMRSFLFSPVLFCFSCRNVQHFTTKTNKQQEKTRNILTNVMCTSCFFKDIISNMYELMFI